MVTATESLKTVSPEQNPEDLFRAVRELLATLRLSEIARGPVCLQADHLPVADSSIEEIIVWLRSLPNSLLTYIYGAEKNKAFRFCPKSERATINQGNRIIKHVSKKIKAHKDRREIYHSVYEKETKEIKEKIEEIHHLQMAMAEETLNRTRRMDYFAKCIQNLERLLKEYEGMTIVEDPEPKSDTKEDRIDSNPHRPNGSNLSDFADDTDSTQQTSTPPPSNREVPNKIRVDQAASSCRERKIKKKEKNNRRKQSKSEAIFSSSHNQSNLSGNGRLTYRLHGYVINPGDGEHIKIFCLKHRARTSELLHEAITQLMKIKAETITVRGENGEEFEINPATATEMQIIDESGKVVATLDAALLLKPDTPEREAAKEKLNVLHYSKELLSILTEEQGAFLLSPTEFFGNPSQILGARPVFVRQNMTEQYVIKATVDSAVLLTSKGRIVEKSRLLNKGKSSTKQHMVEVCNGFMRALKPLAERIRSILLKQVKVWHNDETTFRCMEMLRPPEDNPHLLRSNNYIWALVTGKHEECQGAVYFASRTRKDTEFLSQLGEVVRPEDIAMECFVSDAYQGYVSGIEKLETLLNRRIVKAGCYFHLRKYFIEALDYMGLKDIFYSLSTCTASEYHLKLPEEEKKRGITISTMGYYLLRLTFLIELLLRLDEDFAVSDRATLEERRASVSAGLHSHFYECVKELVDTIPGAKIVEDSEGNQKFMCETKLPCADALRYAINHKKELSAFLTNGDIELTNNISELMIRDIVRTRTSSQHFFSKDGFRAYADLMTIVKTCTLNDINPYYFIQWAFDNAKMRVEEYRVTDRTRESTAQICFLPKPQKVTKDGKKVRISMYDEDYRCCFDEISWNGIDPWTYDRIMDQEFERLKNPPPAETETED